jgi:uncharacterized protein YpuA (DUF1002 family)
MNKEMIRMELVEYEAMLSRVSAFVSGIRDHMDLNQYMDIDDYDLNILDQAVRGISNLQEVQSEDYSDILKRLKAFKATCEHASENDGSVEVDEDEKEIMSEVYTIIQRYYFAEIEKRQNLKLEV